MSDEAERLAAIQRGLLERVVDAGGIEVVGVDVVLREFEESGAGLWSGVQFLLDVDPLLGVSPLEALRAGKLEEVMRSVRAYLDLLQVD